MTPQMFRKLYAIAQQDLRHLRYEIIERPDGIITIIDKHKGVKYTLERKEHNGN